MAHDGWLGDFSDVLDEASLPRRERRFHNLVEALQGLPFMLRGISGMDGDELLEHYYQYRQESAGYMKFHKETLLYRFLRQKVRQELLLRMAEAGY